MKFKTLIFSAFIVVVVAGVPGGFKKEAQAANQSQGTVSTSGDLCGGTGGNGEIISIGSNSFTLKLNEGSNKKANEGETLIVTLANRASIETPNGLVSLSDLKIGDRVTLVGDAHRDGTFTANAVMLCNAKQQSETQENEAGSTSSLQAGQAPSVAVRNKNAQAYEKVNSTIQLGLFLIIALVWFGISTFFLIVKKRGFVYVLFFTIFYVYLYKVLDYTLLQFQSLLLLQHYVPGLMLRGVEAGRSLNLIPFTTLTLEDLKTSLLNILMLIPFGFGLPFISNFRMKKVVIIGLLFSVSIEILQMITGFMANTTFRVADINDLIFNTLGVAAGYLIFVGFIHLFRRAMHNRKVSTNPLVRYIISRPQREEKQI